MTKKSLVLLAIVLLSSMIVSVVSAQKKGAAEDTIPKQQMDPLDHVLNSFAQACSNLDAKAMEDIFLPPDDTPSGKNRKALIDEMKKDLVRMKSRKSNMAVSFKNTKKVVLSEMVIMSDDTRYPADQLPPESVSQKVRFEVVSTEGGWKIQSMEYLK